MRRFAVALFGLAAAALPRLAIGGGPENVAVIVNDASPLSRSIAEYYARRRSIPESNVCHVRAPDAEEISRTEYQLNIAGAVAGLDVFEMTDEQWNSGMELKFHGARRLTIRAWQALRESKGAVVFISGNAAVIPKPGAAAVGAINAAIEVLAKAFAERGIADGVQVNSILPGPVMTGRRESYLAHWAPAHGVSVEDAKEKFLSDVGIERYGRPEEIADLMAFLVSLGARWMTGSAIRMDGGEVKSI